MTATLYHQLPDGRRRAYCTYGDPTGFPVFYAHGGPGSRLEGELFHEAAKRHALRLIAMDRPGLGRSDNLPGRSLLDYPRHIQALADELELERYGLLGWSGGGAPTIAAAYARPAQAAFVISIAGYTNFGEFPGGRELLPPADRRVLKLGQVSPLLARFLIKLMQLYLFLAPGAYLNAFIRQASECDRELLAQESTSHLFLADQQEALRQGVAGLTEDALIQYADWPFSLVEVQPRVHVFQGQQDHFVPPAVGEHLANHLHDGVLHLYPDEGHFLPLSHGDEIFAVARAELEHQPDISR